MQEEVTQKTIALVFKSSRLTADVLKKAMKMYLEHRKQGKQMPHGKISVKELVGQGMGASSIEVTDNNIKSFERVLRRRIRRKSRRSTSYYSRAKMPT